MSDADQAPQNPQDCATSNRQPSDSTTLESAPDAQVQVASLPEAARRTTAADVQTEDAAAMSVRPDTASESPNSPLPELASTELVTAPIAIAAPSPRSTGATAPRIPPANAPYANVPDPIAELDTPSFSTREIPPSETATVTHSPAMLPADHATAVLTPDSHFPTANVADSGNGPTAPPQVRPSMAPAAPQAVATSDAAARRGDEMQSPTPPHLPAANESAKSEATTTPNEQNNAGAKPLFGTWSRTDTVVGGAAAAVLASAAIALVTILSEHKAEIASMKTLMNERQLTTQLQLVQIEVKITEAKNTMKEAQSDIAQVKTQLTDNSAKLGVLDQKLIDALKLDQRLAAQAAELEYLKGLRDGKKR